MTGSTQAPSPSHRPVRWLVAFMFGALLMIVVVAITISAFSGFSLVQFGRMLRGGQVHISVDQPTVIRQIRALQRLETISYTMDKIITGERENPVLPRFLAGDRLLLVVHGEVIAGVDLSRLQPSDVTVNGQSVSIHIPRADILTTRIDSAKTRVYSRDTGLFTTPDPNLESEAREEAERQLRLAALQDGILATADKNARQTLTAMLSSFGFKTVEFH